MPKVVSLHIYPVKSLRGFGVSEAFVERRGLENDRRFMVVNAEGRFQTQREVSKMATVATAIEDGRLFLRCEAGEACVALDARGPKVDVTVWRSFLQADHVIGADDLLSEALGMDCRLVRMTASSYRAPNPDFSSEGDQVSFADGFPVLLASLDSLLDLDHRMQKPVSMVRFRPNVVIEGSEPWEEDGWPRMKVGDVPFRNAKPCGRCIVTTLDPVTGDSLGVEPLATMAEFRRAGNSVNFGINLIPDAEGVVRVGDKVQSW